MGLLYRLGYIVLIIVGGYIASTGIMGLMVSQNISSDGIVTDAQIVETNFDHRSGKSSTTYYKIVVEFQDQANNLVRATLKNSRSSLTPEQAEGKINIIYKKSNPTEAEFNSNYDLWERHIFTLLFSLIFLLFSGHYLLRDFLQQRKLIKLRESGEKIMTTLSDAKGFWETEKHKKVIWPKYIYTKATYMGTERTFKSQFIWKELDKAIISGKIPVYISRANPNDYAMDVKEFL